MIIDGILLIIGGFIGIWILRIAGFIFVSAIETNDSAKSTFIAFEQKYPTDEAKVKAWQDANNYKKRYGSWSHTPYEIRAIIRNSRIEREVRYAARRLGRKKVKQLIALSN